MRLSRLNPPSKFQDSLLLPLCSSLRGAIMSRDSSCISRHCLTGNWLRDVPFRNTFQQFGTGSIRCGRSIMFFYKPVPAVFCFFSLPSLFSLTKTAQVRCLDVATGLVGFYTCSPASPHDTPLSLYFLIFVCSRHHTRFSLAYRGTGSVPLHLFSHVIRSNSHHTRPRSCS